MPRLRSEAMRLRRATITPTKITAKAPEAARIIVTVSIASHLRCSREILGLSTWQHKLIDPYSPRNISEYLKDTKVMLSRLRLALTLRGVNRPSFSRGAACYGIYKDEGGVKDKVLLSGVCDAACGPELG